MKTSHLIIAFLLLSGLITTAQNKSNEAQSLILESQSRFSFTETNDILTKTITENGWKITIIHDLQETMRKNSKEVLPVKVIEICNPGLAFLILSKDELRDVSPMLPCRISVYEKSNGHTYISRLNAAAFSHLIDKEAAKTINLAFDEAEKFVKTVAK